jgi:uncharacterized protein (TIGR02996 family)
MPYPALVAQLDQACADFAPALPGLQDRLRAFSPDHPADEEHLRAVLAGVQGAAARLRVALTAPAPQRPSQSRLRQLAADALATALEALRALARVLLPGEEGRAVSVEDVRRLLPWPARWPALAHAWPELSQPPEHPVMVEAPLRDVVFVFEEVLRRLAGAHGDGGPGWAGTQDAGAERAWLLLLQEQPEDHLQTMAFADWLEEHGDARAEFVRLAGQSQSEAEAWLQGACASRWLPPWLHRQRIPGRPLFRLVLNPCDLTLDPQSEPARVAAWSSLLGSGWVAEVSVGGVLHAPRPWAIAALAGVTRLRLTPADDGDGLEILAHLPGLRTVAFSTAQVSNAGLRRLAGLSGLRHLDLAGCARLTDAGLRHLAGLRDLRFLRLTDCTGLTDAGLRHLAGLTALRQLILAGCRFTGAGLEHLRGMADLRELKLAVCDRLTDAALAPLGNLDALERLDLAWCVRLTDAGMRFLGQLPSLEELNLGRCPIGDGGVQHLAGLAGLRVLNLDMCPITDAGLRHLGGLGALRRLCLSRCGRLTGAGLPHLAGGCLEELDLFGCDALRDAALLDYLPGLSSLRSLNLNLCRGLTRYGVDALRALLPGCNITGP